MFYLISPTGMPTSFESFEAYYQMMVNHAASSREAGHARPTPDRREWYCVEIPDGFDGRPTKIWRRGERFVGYEF